MKRALWLTASLLFGLSTYTPAQFVQAAEPELPSDHDVYPPRDTPPVTPSAAPESEDTHEETEPETVPEAQASPSMTPLTPRPPFDSPSPQLGSPELAYEFPAVTEGQRFQVKLRVKNELRGMRFPIKGSIEYEDSTYDREKVEKISVPFTLRSGTQSTVDVVFRSAGRKTVKIKTESQMLAERNILVYAEPFPATIFPRSVDSSDYDKDPKNWHAYVNLYHSNRSGQAQRQYYMVTYKGEIQQRLLTSGAGGGRVTPQGKFKLGEKMANPVSTKYASVMPYWTTVRIPGYSYEYGNHGLLGESYLYLLGTPASHGCLRLSHKWVQRQGKSLNIGGAHWVYKHVPEGTPIHIFRRPAQPFRFENYRMWLARR